VVKARDAASLLEQLSKHGLRAWVAGGWAVDALVGEQTRLHGDLDLAVDADELTELIGVLNGLGYSITTNSLPSRVELTDHDMRRVDLHPVRFRADGGGSQAGLDETSFEYQADGFSTGTIDGHQVPCLSGTQQLSFRHGYDWRQVDHHDVPLIRMAIGRTG
jgi:lincosamide nucleotidyltransferase A/C/D/E